jgi:serine/threonine-protein kinase
MGAIPSVQVYNDNVTPEFAELLKKMMAKRREARPVSMWEFLSEFRSMRVLKILPKPPKPDEIKDHRKGFV